MKIHRIACALGMWLLAGALQFYTYADIVLAATDYAQGPFILRVLDQGDTFWEPDFSGNSPEPQKKTATGSFTADEFNAVSTAMNYWLERVDTGRQPALIMHLAKKAERGSAYNWSPDNDQEEATLFYYLTEGILLPTKSPYNYHSEMVFQVDYSSEPTRLLLNDNSIVSTVTHEMMHALGMVAVLQETGNPAKYSAATGSDAWTAKLYDIYGTRMRIHTDEAPGTEIKLSSGNPSEKNGDTFFLPMVSASHLGTASDQFFPVFHGPAVDALTEGRGMPVMGGGGKKYEILGGQSLSHPALLGSIMSYSPVRNMLFTELELSVLKDMGYNINPSDFFGKSYYPTNLGGKLTLDDPAVADYAHLPETALTVTNGSAFSSSASFATGLHVYRDKLTVTQTGDINVSGYGAGGIRVDGVGNTVNVPEGVTIAADGNFGTGVLVSYGRENILNLAGNISAKDAGGGVALHFGITGTPDASMGHSYKYTDLTGNVNSDEIYYSTKMNSDLNGALANKVNISGTLEGGYAAVLVDRDAHVKEFNIMSGAGIHGDVLVRWDPWGLLGPGGSGVITDKNTFLPYMTSLNFGVDANGNPDPGFVMRYDGTIDGRAQTYDDNTKTTDTGNAALSFNLKGGTLSYNGMAYITGGVIDNGATLKGNATYTLSSPHDVLAGDNVGKLINSGTISPGNSLGSIKVVGDFINNGIFLMEFDNHGNTDTFTVTGTFTDTNTDNKSVNITPVRDFYSGTRPMPTINSMFTFGAGSDPIDLLDFIAPSSPTFIMTYDMGARTYSTNRAANAYSQWGATKNAAAAGRALDRVDFAAVNAASDFAQLLTTLDFSAPDGSVVGSALRQLAPESYNALTFSQMRYQRALSTMLHSALSDPAQDASRVSGLAGGDPGKQWTAFALPFAFGQQQNSGDSLPGYASDGGGIMGGLSRAYDSGLSVGMHAMVGAQRTETKDSSRAQMHSNSLGLGVHAFMRPASHDEFSLYGMVRVGIDNTKSERPIAIDNYYRTNRAEFTGHNINTLIGASYDVRFDALTLSPLVGLDYAAAWRPGIEENNGGGTRLTMDAASWHSLQSVLGVQASTKTSLSERSTLNAGIAAQWKYELLDPRYEIRAAFAESPAVSFSTQNTLPSQGSLGMQAFVSVQHDEGFKMSVFAGTDLLQRGYSSVYGGLSLAYSF